jgi:hypothetical protein
MKFQIFLFIYFIYAISVARPAGGIMAVDLLVNLQLPFGDNTMTVKVVGVNGEREFVISQQANSLTFQPIRNLKLIKGDVVVLRFHDRLNRWLGDVEVRSFTVYSSVP